MTKGNAAVFTILPLAIVLLLSFSLAPALAAESVYRLDEVKALAIQNSREGVKNQLNTLRANYSYEQAQEDYDDYEQPASWASYSDAMTRLQLLNDQKRAYEAAGNADPGEIAKIDANIALQEKTVESEEDRYRKDVNNRDSLKNKLRDAGDALADAKTAQAVFEEELKYKVEKAYTDILLQEQNRLMLLQKANYQKRLLEQEKKRLEIGATSQEKVNQIAMNLADANLAVSEAEKTLTSLRGALNDSIGNAYDAKFTLLPFDAPASGQLPTYETLLPAVRSQYAKLSQLHRDIEKKEDDLKEYNEDDDDYSEYNEAIKGLEIKEMKNELNDEECKLVKTLKDILADVTSKRENQEHLQLELEKVARQHDWNKQRYELGLISPLTLMQSDLDLLEAKQKLKAGEYSRYLMERTVELLGKGIIVSSAG
ncbi:DUF773 domain-containing protein [Heliobacterium gestii]|uniref:DUF773 domain-containing protein n=1 Tax=Heliomicrobium gestii TaxID=2699 RepID=A0A845L639_HELGE|nr:CDK5 domain-containing protein [Heliomicrobium gestii]MBM7865411.1 outer membrane protein TolC [Heliomicrobium gestii]MZP41668.1 DUF773 domain-containing protein [Heliomicrobium gestii]